MSATSMVVSIVSEMAGFTSLLYVALTVLNTYLLLTEIEKEFLS
jgi:hypothetical protein